jgi:hypothetical protein
MWCHICCKCPYLLVSLVGVQEAPTPGAPGSGGRQELLSAARTMLDRKAVAVGKRGAHFPLLLNSSGVMVKGGGGCLSGGGGGRGGGVVWGQCCCCGCGCGERGGG